MDTRHTDDEPDAAPSDRTRLLERMSDRYVSLDDEWRVRAFDDGGYEALASLADDAPSEADLRGRVLWELVPSAEGSTAREALHSAAEEGRPVTFESNLEHLGGWFEFRAYPDSEGLSVLFTPTTREDERERGIERRTAIINELYDVFHDVEASFESKVRSLLSVGRRTLGTEYASLSRVDGEEYVFEFVDDDDGALTAGAEVELSWTSCEVVVANEERLVLSDMVTEAPELLEKKGNRELGLSCYIGTPVEVGGEVYGTLCFYDREPKTEPFSEWEAGLVDFMGLLVSYELQRRRTERRLRARNERLEEFRSVLSHDLRNPVTVAKGYVDVAREEPEVLEEIEDALDRMDGIIDDVSDVAAADDSLSPTAVDVGEAARAAWKMVVAGDSRLAVRADRPVEADESSLRRLLQNLLSNAVTHSDDPVTVEVGTLEDGFYVADSGDGVDETVADDLFEPGITTDAEGTGLGLAIVGEIADRHGWSCEATESADGGVRFEFTGVTRR